MRFIYCVAAIVLSLPFVLVGQVLTAKSGPAPQKPLSPGLLRISKEDRDALLRLDHRVLLNVVVTDPSGAPVGGLKEEDFTVLDQSGPQAINSFQMVEGNSPTGRAHIVLLIDSVNNSFADVARQRRGGRCVSSSE
ncbi:hypothetical protein HDF16_003523 [Granulicella aggregans]|uniref:Uncharacterized protein n=1 Tax=Granulicella aggregans TaxID=474949 RepID=A0A7W7ZF81_9BACT|nr:hypothetical protein [Granulicella aggregans]